MSSIVRHLLIVNFVLTFRKISFFAFGFALQNLPEHPRVEGGMVFYLFPDTAGSLPAAHCVTQIINSYTLNMRTHHIKHSSLFMFVYNTCILRMVY